MRTLLSFKAFAVAVLIFVLVGAALAGTADVRPYGIASPYWFNYTSGARASYYLAAPTLSANDTACGIAATQTLTNKTLTSPTITGMTATSATLTSPTITSPTITLGSITNSTITNATSSSGTFSSATLSDPVMLYAVTNAIANTVIAAADCGKVYNNAGDSDGLVFTLPALAAGTDGCSLVFVHSAAAGSNFDIDPAGSDQILGTSAAGDYIRSTGIGNVASFFGMNGVGWGVINSSGWTEE